MASSGWGIVAATDRAREARHDRDAWRPGRPAARRPRGARGRGGARRRPARAGPTAGAAMTVRAVDAVADALRDAGVRRIYGVPGEGSTIDLADAAHARGIAYVLAAHEGGAAFMAAAEAELTGRPGV